MSTYFYIGSRNLTIIAVLICALLTQQTQALEPERNQLQEWQHNLLLNLSETQLKRVQKDFVFIYDGITEKTVNRVMDNPFDRLSSMMFVHTVVSNNQGNAQTSKGSEEIDYEDDDIRCD